MAFISLKYQSNQPVNSFLLASANGKYNKSVIDYVEEYTPKYGINPLAFTSNLIGQHTSKITGTVMYVNDFDREYDYVFEYPVLNFEQDSDSYAINSSLKGSEKNVMVTGYEYNFAKNPEQIASAWGLDEKQ